MGCQSSGVSVFQVQQGQGERMPQLQKKPEELIQVINQEELERNAGNLFETCKWDEAALVYRRIIQHRPDFDYQIDGLGCKEEQSGYYEWVVETWYKNQKLEKRIKGAPYDALSLCLSKNDINDVDSFNSWKYWYEGLIEKHPKNYQLHFGLGNLLYNQGIYEQAVKSYGKVIQIKLNFVPAYVDTAFIYQYQRIEKKKSMQWANKALQLDPKNQFALFIIARNQKQIKNKIQKLKPISEIFPKYTRSTNQIGIAYGAGLKDYNQAIKCYIKCLEYSPKYFSCYNNIGVNYEIMENYDEAKIWYFKGCEAKCDYKAPHTNLSDIVDKLKTKDEDILIESRKYNIKQDYFCYYMGLAYYDKKQNKKSIQWYERALQLDKNNYKVYNSLAITYDQMKDYDLAIQNYNKCIQLKPTYHSAYYNMAICYKNKNGEDQAIKWYIKATEINPRYSYAYNNLGNIYKSRNQNSQAIKCYDKAVTHNVTYTLAFANMGLCYLRISKFKDAFNCFSRAEQILPTDNNNLSDGNRTFLKEQLAKFNKEGESWKMNGSIDPQMKERLNALIKQFQQKFKSLYSGISLTDQVHIDKILKPQITSIIKLIHEDKFELTNIGQIFNLVKSIFHEDEEYFHIIPQLFIQFFWNHSYERKESILKVEQTLQNMLHIQSAKIANQNTVVQSNPIANKVIIKCENFNPSDDCKVNLFKDAHFFTNYEQLYSEIVKVNAASKLSLKQFAHLVEQVRKSSNGFPVGTCMKIPQKQQEQFKVILRILEKMLKKEIDRDRVKVIIQKIDDKLKKDKNVTLVTVVHQIMQTWTDEITQILANRRKNQIVTEFGITDLVRGKCMFTRIEDIKKAVSVADKLCKQRGYEIIELDNRLSKKETMDVVLKIRIKEAVCEFQLAMKQDESKYHFIHSIYEIERSPLGCIFGSYLYMSKGFKYPLIANCADITTKLKDSSKTEDKIIVSVAQYVVDALKEK